MPDGLAVAVGVVLLVVTGWDVVTTVFGASMGSGPITRGWTRLLSRVAGGLRRHRAVMVWLGPLSAAATTPVWLGLLWLGWGLVFQPEGSVVGSTTGVPATDWEQAYYVGYTISTLGNGEFLPTGPLWQALTVVAAASGFIVITVGLSYVIALVGAANQRNTVAVRVHALGHTPTDVAVGAWDGRDLHQIDVDLHTLHGSIDQVAQQHLAYPVLRHFHSTEHRNALAPRLAALDEALTLMECGIRRGHGPRLRTVRQTRAAIERFLVLERRPRRASDPPPPPPPDLAPLRAAGLPVVDDAEFGSAVDRCRERRTALRRFVEGDGWAWTDVSGAGRPG